MKNYKKHVVTTDKSGYDLSSSQQTQNIYNMCTTSVQRLHRWSNIVQMLHKWFVFAGMCV